MRIPSRENPNLPQGEGGPPQRGMRAVRGTGAEKPEANSYKFPENRCEFAEAEINGETVLALISHGCAAPASPEGKPEGFLARRM